MAILTTTIGAYPKPLYVPVANWWQVREVSRTNPTRTYDEFLKRPSAGDADLLDRGTQEAVRDQVEAGIDIPTDGEIRREHYVYYHCRNIDGIDFEDLTTKDMRQGSWQAQVPTVRGLWRRGDRSCRTTGVRPRRPAGGPSRLRCRDP